MKPEDITPERITALLREMSAPQLASFCRGLAAGLDRHKYRDHVAFFEEVAKAIDDYERKKH